MYVWRSLLIFILLLSGCSGPQTPFPSAEQANWKKLSDPSATMRYNDLAPLLNKAHHQQAKGVTAAVENIEDSALIYAHLALLDNKYNQAYHHLQSHILTPSSSLEHQLFFEVYRKSDHIIQALWYANTQQAGDFLNQQSVSRLKKLPSFNEETATWRDFFLILKNHQQLPEHFYYELKKFQEKYPNHPATELLDLSKPPTNTTVNLGILLPLSGPMADVGQSIREGMMAAHFNSPLKKDWTLLFFDTNQTPLTEILRGAEQNHITHWIGPVEKEAAQKFAHLAPNSDQVLLLNSVESQPSETRSFTLTPENEAIQVSNHLIKNGYRHVLIIKGHHPWSHRQAEAFIKNFTGHGGHIVETKTLTGKYAKDIKEALRIPESQHHYQQLQRQTSTPIKFLASSRQDVDAIFLATSHEEALQIKPLLKLNMTQNYTPIFATSSIVNDRSSSQRNKDLDGLIFCDGMIPNNDTSTSSLESQIKSLMNELQSTHSQRFQDLQRFYALGIDAYHLQLYKHYMDITPTLGLPSASGQSLTLQGNQIKTKLYWGKYQQGKQVNITEQLD
jgi:outer membrane PBP1 activator LpoA protein